jgi:hypothetical protein
VQGGRDQPNQGESLVSGPPAWAAHEGQLKTPIHSGGSDADFFGEIGPRLAAPEPVTPEPHATDTPSSVVVRLRHFWLS